MWKCNLPHFGSVTFHILQLGHTWPSQGLVFAQFGLPGQGIPKQGEKKNIFKIYPLRQKSEPKFFLCFRLYLETNFEPKKSLRKLGENGFGQSVIFRIWPYGSLVVEIEFFFSVANDQVVQG